MSPQMEQDVAPSRDRRELRATYFSELAQPHRTRHAEEAVPEPGAKPDDTCQLALGKTKPDRAGKPAHIGEQVPDLFLGTGVHRQDEEDRSLGKWGQNWLWLERLHTVSVIHAQLRHLGQKVPLTSEPQPSESAS